MFSKRHSSNQQILNAKHTCEIEEEEEEEEEKQEEEEVEEEDDEEEKDLCQPCRLNEQVKKYIDIGKFCYKFGTIVRLCRSKTFRSIFYSVNSRIFR